MAVIKLFVAVNNIADVAARYTEIRVYRSTTGPNGTYSEVTTAVTRPKIVPGQALYTWFDDAGAASYWYKTDYYNSTSLAASAQSDPVLGDEAEILSGILTVQQLKDIYLFGVDLTNDYGVAYPDIMYDFAIRAAIAWFEHETSIDVRPKNRVDRYDYNQTDFQGAWGFIQLDHYPCLEWDAVTLGHYVKMYWPSASDPYVFPTDWVRFDRMAGQINLVPTSGSLGSALMLSGALLPTVLSRLPWVPRAIEVKYTSGFQYGDLPADVRDLIGMRASFPIFNVAGDLVAGAGIANYSISVDGLTQSVGTTASATNAGYGARLVEYQKEIRERMPSVRRYYKNAAFAVAG